jgi:CHAT domain-containing protein/tetratricopeptide (TPR) repeat protein
LLIVVVCGPLLGGQTSQPLVAVDDMLAAGRYGDAEAAARGELQRVEAIAGRESAAAAHVLNRLNEAAVHVHPTDADTEQSVLRARALLERIEPGSIAFASAVRIEGLLYDLRGAPAEAVIRYARALELFRAAAGADDRATLLTQKDLAMSYADQGDFAKARGLLEDAIARRSRGDAQHVDLAVFRHNLGVVYWQLGEYANARDAFATAAAGFEAAYGENDRHVATALEGLAVIRASLGEYAEALALYRRTLAIRERILPPGDADFANSYVNIGDVLLSMGDYTGARTSLTRAVAIFEQALGPGHPRLIAALTDLAYAREKLGDRAGARRAFERGIAIRERAIGADDPDLVIPLTQLANLVADAGNLPRARALYARARAIAERTRGADHPYAATADLDEGVRLAARGDVAAATPLIARARRIREAALGGDHPDVAAALDAVARLDAQARRDAAAIDLALRAEGIARRHFQATAPALSEPQALTYAEQRTRSQDLALRTAVRTPSADPERIERLWDAVIRSRALVLDEMASRRRLVVEAHDPQLSRAFDEAASARARLAQLFLRGPSSDRPDDYARQVTEARTAAASGDARLGEISGAFRAGRLRSAVGFAAVREALPPDTALVSFVRYADTLYELPTVPRRFAYAALVLASAAHPPQLIPLGPAASIDRLVVEWRRQIRDEADAPPMGAAARERAYRAVAIALRRRIWDRLSPLLAARARVLVVPDAGLHLVDIAALPAPGGGYIIDRGPTLHYASAERDLIATEDGRGDGLLALGAPAFAGQPVSPPAAAAALRSHCQIGGLGARFAPLPESGREVEAVARLWKGQPGGAIVLRGAEASEASIKALARGHRVIHLATHGFVMGEGCAIADPAAQAANPLIGAGLVLAGAGRARPSADEDDGILTAEEISALDLSGVEWAVLSACDSGVGTARASEGVFGLRRAFQIAGVHTVIMSLWPVDDRLARTWMEALYTARVADHQTTADAVRHAAQSMLRARRRSGGSTHPFYWTGFVAAGAWR